MRSFGGGMSSCDIGIASSAPSQNTRSHGGHAHHIKNSAINDAASASKEDAKVGVAERAGRGQQGAAAIDKAAGSLLHDLYLSEVYEQKYRTAEEVFLSEDEQHFNDVEDINFTGRAGEASRRGEDPHSGSLEVGSSSSFNVVETRRGGSPVAAWNSSVPQTVRRAFRDEILDRSRPVLANELSDFKTPYMMKREAQKRLLEHVARNDMERRLIDKVLDERRDLVKARVKADLPPEALEPLYAFCGVRDWNFCAKRRLSQQMRNVERLMRDAEKFAENGRVRKERHTLKEEGVLVARGAGDEDSRRADPRAFVSQSDFGEHTFTGSYKLGKPVQAELLRTKALRYPTLQSVCRDLPADPTYRSHVLRCVRVLERQPGWTQADKVRAINVMKTVYHNLRGSAHWRTLLDRKLPLWTPGIRMRKYIVRQGWAKRDKWMQSLGANYKKKMRPQNRQRGGLIVMRRKVM